MVAVSCLVKRKGVEQEYDGRKVYASVYAAALVCGDSESESEKLAHVVEKKVNAWLHKQPKKKVIDSVAVRKKVKSFIADRDVKLMYDHHLDVS